jgi:hypothetical protein
MLMERRTRTQKIGPLRRAVANGDYKVEPYKIAGAIWCNHNNASRYILDDEPTKDAAVLLFPPNST